MLPFLFIMYKLSRNLPLVSAKVPVSSNHIKGTIFCKETFGTCQQLEAICSLRSMTLCKYCINYEPSVVEYINKRMITYSCDIFIRAYYIFKQIRYQGLLTLGSAISCFNNKFFVINSIDFFNNVTFKNIILL